MSRRIRHTGWRMLPAALVLAAGAAGVAGAGTPAGTGAPGAAAPAAGAIDAKAALDRLKGLAGTWEGTTPAPEGVAMRTVFAVTAGGTAVMETQFPGTGHEMVTLYFLDGPALRATHYCAAGNQPHLKLDTKASTAADLRFAFDGGTNFDPKKDMHIHSARFILGEDGALREEWEYRNEGKTSGTHKVTLTRKS